MYYMLMIHVKESDWTGMDEAQQAEIMSQHEALEQSLRKSGKYLGCGGLATTDAATTVRFEGAKALVVDGPFAETKEQFGGYYLVDAKDLDDAIEIAKRIPHVADASIEIRPVLDLRT